MTAEQVADWSSRGSYPGDFDRSSLWATLTVAGQGEELALTEAAEERASDDVARLNALLEHRPLEDPEALQELLLEHRHRRGRPLLRRGAHPRARFGRAQRRLRQHRRPAHPRHGQRLRHVADNADRDSPQYAAWREIEELMEQIGETRRIGGGG